MGLRHVRLDTGIGALLLFLVLQAARLPSEIYICSASLRRANRPSALDFVRYRICPIGLFPRLERLPGFGIRMLL